MDNSTFNAVFFLSLGTMIFAFGALLLKYGLQSRCIKCSICYGLIAVERDPQAENVELQDQLEHGINPDIPRERTPPESKV